jgi:hypothetical protein
MSILKTCKEMSASKIKLLRSCSLKFQLFRKTTALNLRIIRNKYKKDELFFNAKYNNHCLFKALEIHIISSLYC